MPRHNVLLKMQEIVLQVTHVACVRVTVGCLRDLETLDVVSLVRSDWSADAKACTIRKDSQAAVQ